MAVDLDDSSDGAEEASDDEEEVTVLPKKQRISGPSSVQ